MKAPFLSLFPEKTISIWNSGKNIDKDGLEEQFKKYCEAVNINEDDLTLMISNDFKDKNEIKPSVWIELLEKFLTYESILTIKEKNNDLPFYDILFPLVDFSISSIERILSNNLVNTLQSFFYKDLISSCYNVFLDEFLFF